LHARNDEVLVGCQPEGSLVNPRDITHGVQQLQRQATALDENGAVVPAIRRFIPAKAVAIAREGEGTCFLERRTHMALELGPDPVETLGIFRVFEAGMQALLTVAIIALHRHHSVSASEQPVNRYETDQACKARIGFRRLIGAAHAATNYDVEAF